MLNYNWFVILNRYLILFTHKFSFSSATYLPIAMEHDGLYYNIVIECQNTCLSIVMEFAVWHVDK